MAPRSLHHAEICVDVEGGEKKKTPLKTAAVAIRETSSLCAITLNRVDNLLVGFSEHY